MGRKTSRRWATLLLMGILIFVIGCGLFQNPVPDTTQTLTSTPTPEVSIVTAPAMTNRCQGLSGFLEMQVLAGPAAAVGMEPLAVGTIPFSVATNGEAHIVQGSGAVAYQQVLEKKWGTYTVNLDMNAIISGECGGEAGNEVLNMTVELNGEQMVEVRAEGFEGDYPWSGTYERNLSLPLEEGASAEGEGWAFILHLNE